MRIVGPTRLAFTRRGWLSCARLAVILVLALATDTYAQSPDRARRPDFPSGAMVGHEDGAKAGYAEAFAATEQAAFEEALAELKQSGNVTTVLSRRIRIWGEWMLVGLTAQWLLLYVLRRVCGLPDIDWMVLPGRLTAIKLTGGTSVMSPRALQRIVPLLMASWLGGCGGLTDAARSSVDHPRYDLEFHAGWEEGVSHGSVDGRLAGINRAFAVAKSGQSWRLYPVHVVSATFVGAVLGLLAQYVYLLSMRQSGQLNAMWSVFLVPGIRSSYAYQVYVRRREFMVWMQDEAAKVRAHQRIRRAQLEAVKSLVYKKAVTLADLDEFIQSRLIEAAHAKMSEIVAAAEWEASSATDPQAADVPSPIDHPAGADDDAEIDSVTPHSEATGETETAKPADRWMPIIESITYSVGE